MLKAKIIKNLMLLLCLGLLFMGIILIIIKSRILGIISLGLSLIISIANYKYMITFFTVMNEVFAKIKLFRDDGPEQKIRNSNGSVQIQGDRNVVNLNIDRFPPEMVKDIIKKHPEVKIKDVKKNVSKSITKKINEDVNEAKKLIDKINHDLVSSEPLSKIIFMCLKLARHLDMQNSSILLEKEIVGYGETQKINSPLRLAKKDHIKFPRHRNINARFYLESKVEEIKEFDLSFFIAESIYTIEEWAEKYGKEDNLIMYMPPLDMMVKVLKIPANSKIPYIITGDSLKNVLRGCKIFIIKFLTEAERNLKVKEASL